MARRVLYVEDSPTMQRVMEIVWMGAGAEVVGVSSSAEAVDRLASFSAELAIVDAGLAGPDHTLCAVLKAARPELQVLLLGSARRPLDAAAAASAGADGQLDKPFSPAELLGRASSLLERPRPTQPRPAGGARPLRRGLPPPARDTAAGSPPAAGQGGEAAARALSEAVRAEAQRIVEAVAWEVVPELAESAIRSQLEARAKA